MRKSEVFVYALHPGVLRSFLYLCNTYTTVNKPLRLIPVANRSTASLVCGRTVRSAILLCSVVLLLSGCMEALQQTERPVIVAPPSALSASQAYAEAQTASTSTVQSNLAPDPATAEPSASAPVGMATNMPLTATTTTLPPLQLPTVTPMSHQERWRLQQIERTPLPELRPFTTTGSDLWWFDPINQQAVILGRISGTFLVQATFTLKDQQRLAYEVPYQVNQSYGLTAISPILIKRIEAAGYQDWIETYVVHTAEVRPN